MRASEILRNLADVIDSVESPEPVDVTTVVDEPQTGKFIPPLQAKLELLKKAVDVDNVYDTGEPDQVDDTESDELERMKFLSGVFSASDDDVLDQ